MDAICERVRYLADNTGGTHREFADRVGLDPTKLSKSLHGTRRFRTEELLAVAERTGASTDWLLLGTGPTPALPGRPSAAVRPDRVGEARRRGAILDTTWHLVARHGYRVRLTDIAAGCGTSVPALRHHFPSKRQLLQTALLHCSEQAFARQQQELDRTGAPRAALGQLIEQLLPLPGRSRDEWLIWLHVSTEAALRPELRPVHRDFHRRWIELVAGVVARGTQEGTFTCADPARFALEFMALTDGLAVRVLTGTRGHDVARMREMLRDHARSGLALDLVRP